MKSWNKSNLKHPLIGARAPGPGAQGMFWIWFVSGFYIKSIRILHINIEEFCKCHANSLIFLYHPNHPGLTSRPATRASQWPYSPILSHTLSYSPILSPGFLEGGAEYPTFWTFYYIKNHGKSKNFRRRGGGITPDQGVRRRGGG